MDISKGGRYTGQRVRRPCNVPTNQRHGPGHGEVIDIRRCERIAGNPSCQSLLDPGSRGKCHEYATIEVSKRTHPRHPRAFTRRWGVTARDTRIAVASTLQIPRWTVHSKRTRFESTPITLMNQTRQDTRVRARIHARGLSIYLWKLSAFPFDCCSLPVTDTANCPGPPTIDIHAISTRSFTNSPSLRFLFLFFFLSFFLSFFSLPRLLHDWSTLSYCRFHGCLRNVRPRIDSLGSYGTGEKGRDRAKLLPRELRLFFFFFKDNLAFRSRFCIKKCEREKRLCRYLELLNHRIYGLCGIFRNKILDVFQSESD